MIPKSFTPHLKNFKKKKSKNYDIGGYFPNSKLATEYQNRVKTLPYHRDRLNCIKFLTDKIKKKKLVVLDFGCGDGLQFKKLKLSYKKYIGIDISQHMLDLNKKSLKHTNSNSLINGGVNKLKKVKSNSVDLVLALNVLGYLTEKDQKIFFKEVGRILKKKQFFISTNGNELFDLFSLNNHTKIFFENNFKQKASHLNLLLKKTNSNRYVLGKRFNPLRLEKKLKIEFHLTTLDFSFASLHKYSPEIGKILNRKKKTKNKYLPDYRHQQLLSRDFSKNPNKLPLLEKWKCLFLCSIFGILVQK